MYHRWAALLAVLALGAVKPAVALGQTKPGSPPGSLGQNYPNPFNPETRIPFAVGDSTCSGTTQYRVTIDIFDVLGHKVAVPILQGLLPSAGQQIADLPLPCGQYTAFWNGKNQLDRGRQA